MIKAILRIIFNAPESFEQNVKALPLVACHEAGHALVSELLEPGSVNLVTALNHESGAGGLTSVTKDECYVCSKELMEIRVMHLLAGKAATEICYGTTDMGAKVDLTRAYSIVYRFTDEHCSDGFNKFIHGGHPSNELLNRRDAFVAKEMDKYYEKTKKLIEGKFRNPTVEYLKDCEWQFTEKVDGTNIRVLWNGHNVEFGGRTDKAIIPKPLEEKLKELFSSYETEQIFEQHFGEKEVFLFGEGYGGKIQGVGNQYREDVDFILFDVMINGNYQPRENVESIAKTFGIDVVPIVLEGTLQKGVDYVKTNRKSFVARNGAEIEGLVARPKLELQDRTGNRVIVKIKYRDFEPINWNDALKRKPEVLATLQNKEKDYVKD